MGRLLTVVLLSVSFCNGRFYLFLPAEIPAARVSMRIKILRNGDRLARY